MPHSIDQDVMSIKEWLAKENYLPEDLDDLMLKKFVHSCYNSLEKTKKCIEKFSIGRCNMPELYLGRDPLSKKLQTAFSITCISTFQADGNEILIHQMHDKSLEKFDFYDILTTLSIQADYWIKIHEVLPDGHIIILDIKDYSLRLLTKVNVMFFREFILYLLEAMPVRLKQIHVINCPSFYDKLYMLVKPVLPAEITNIIKFHPNVESLHSVVDKKHLPVEYGGDAPSMKEQYRNWVENIEKDRKLFLNDNLWKADLKKKPKTNAVETVMKGSFKTLSID